MMLVPPHPVHPSHAEIAERKGTGEPHRAFLRTRHPPHLRLSSPPPATTASVRLYNQLLLHPLSHHLGKHRH